MKKILGSLLILIISLYASVDLKVDKLGFYKGDTVNITISATGEDVEFPDIDQIGGYQIVGISNGSQTTIVNSKVSHTLTRTYTIVPQNTFTIEPLRVIVDGKAELTPKKEIKLLKPSASAKQGGNFILELKADKTHLKVGESTTLKLVFKKKVDARVDKILVDEFKNSNFWIKRDPNYEKYLDGDYEVYVYKYKITPQKSGTFIIDPLKVTIGYLVQQQTGGFNDPFFDQFFQTMRYKKVFSNSLTFKVDALPQNVEVYGDFNIFATVDKKEVLANKPVNLTIKILGEGNVEDIKKFDINLPDAVVYSDEPKTNPPREFTQKIAIISDKSYTIPSIKFKYFDKNLNKVVTKETKPIKIEVKGSPKTTHQDIEVAKPVKAKISTKTKVVQKEENSYLKYIYLVVGLIAGSLITFFANNLKRPKREPKPLEKKIRKAKTDKELYELLLPFANENEIKPILEKLEENIYHDKKNKIDKEDIVEILEEI